MEWKLERNEAEQLSGNYFYNKHNLKLYINLFYMSFVGLTVFGNWHGYGSTISVSENRDWIHSREWYRITSFVVDLVSCYMTEIAIIIFNNFTQKIFLFYWTFSWEISYGFILVAKFSRRIGRCLQLKGIHYFEDFKKSISFWIYQIQEG